MLGSCLATGTTDRMVHVWRPNLVGEFTVVSVVQGCSEAATEEAGGEGMVVQQDVD